VASAGGTGEAPPARSAPADGDPKPTRWAGTSAAPPAIRRQHGTVPPHLRKHCTGGEGRNRDTPGDRRAKLGPSPDLREGGGFKHKPSTPARRTGGRQQLERPPRTASSRRSPTNPTRVSAIVAGAGTQEEARSRRQHTAPATRPPPSWLGAGMRSQVAMCRLRGTRATTLRAAPTATCDDRHRLHLGGGARDRVLSAP